MEKLCLQRRVTQILGRLVIFTIAIASTFVLDMDHFLKILINSQFTTNMEFLGKFIKNLDVFSSIFIGSFEV